MLVDGYVKEEEGTGVVHQAPYFGAVSMNSTSLMFILANTCYLAFLGTLRVIDKQSSHLLLNNVRISCSFVFSWTLPLSACAGLEIFCVPCFGCVVMCELKSPLFFVCHWSQLFSECELRALRRVHLWHWQWKLALLSDNFGWEQQLCSAHCHSSAFQFHYSLGF